MTAKYTPEGEYFMGMTLFIQSTILQAQMSAMNPHQPAQGEEKSLNILYSAYGSQTWDRVKSLLLVFYLLEQRFKVLTWNIFKTIPEIPYSSSSDDFIGPAVNQVYFLLAKFLPKGLWSPEVCI